MNYRYELETGEKVSVFITDTGDRVFRADAIFDAMSLNLDEAIAMSHFLTDTLNRVKAEVTRLNNEERMARSLQDATDQEALGGGS